MSRKLLLLLLHLGLLLVLGRLDLLGLRSRNLLRGQLGLVLLLLLDLRRLGLLLLLNLGLWLLHLLGRLRVLLLLDWDLLVMLC